jgi:hypothetical protein
MRWLIEQDRPDFLAGGVQELAGWMRAHIDNCRAYLDVVRETRWPRALHRTEVRDPNGGPVPELRKRPHVKRRSKRPRLRMPPSPSALDREFGTAVRAKRESLGLSVGELAKNTGMRSSNVAALEEGRYELPLIWMYVVCRALKTAPSRIIAKVEKRMRKKPPNKKVRRS